MTSHFHIFQAEAFIDYSPKFRPQHKRGLLVPFDNWANSKMFCEKDRQIILKLVEEYYLGKSKKVEHSKNSENTGQIEFDF